MKGGQGLGLDMQGQGNVFEDLDELDTVDLPDETTPAVTVGHNMPAAAQLPKKKGPNDSVERTLGGHSAYKPVVYGVLAAAALLVAFL